MFLFDLVLYNIIIYMLIVINYESKIKNYLFLAKEKRWKIKTMMMANNRSYACIWLGFTYDGLGLKLCPS